MKKGIILLVLLLACAMLFSCTHLPNEEDFRIVTTMFPQYDFAREIVGDKAEIELLLDFGADSHSYEPTPLDLMKIASADLFIYTGDGMELWAKELLESEDVKRAVDSGDLKLLDLSKHTELLDMHEDGHSHSHTHDCEYDTHIWTSIANAEKICDAIAASVCETDKSNADYYTANLKEYKEKLGTIKALMQDVKSNARLNTAFFGGSFAFRYMFHEIGLTHRSVFEGCSSHAEASAKDIILLSNELSEAGAKYVLYDNPSEKKIAEAIAAECDVDMLRLHAIHNITKAEFEAGNNYISLMKSNLETLRKALS